MTEGSTSSDIRTVLKDLSQLNQAEPGQFERVARWRRACGDADGAATWQTWSLLPPDQHELRRSLSQLWLSLDETELAAEVLGGEAETSKNSWEQLTLVLKQGRLREAAELQHKLLINPPDLNIQLLLGLVVSWKSAEQPQQALDLLQPMLVLLQQRGEHPSSPLCNTVALLLDELKRFEEAEQWWLRSHRMQPQQIWPLMSLGRHALRKQQFHVVVHYATEVLRREPDHLYAPELQQQGLLGMGATNSLALIDGDASPQPKLDPHFQPPDPELWRQCRHLALVGFSQATIAEAWLRALAEEAMTEKALGSEPIEPKLPLKLWLIASPDPLWLRHHVETLRSTLDQAIEIEQWPSWDPQRHGSAQLVLQYTDECPGWIQQSL